MDRSLQGDRTFAYPRYRYKTPESEFQKVRQKAVVDDNARWIRKRNPQKARQVSVRDTDKILVE